MKNSTKIKIWAYFMRLGSRCGCHQREDRSFHYKQWQFPICSRCMGILIGQLLGFILYGCGIRIPIWGAFAFLLIMFLDWYIQYKNIKESTNIRRLVTGTLAGIGQTSILIEGILTIVKFFIG